MKHIKKNIIIIILILSLINGIASTVLPSTLSVFTYVADNGGGFDPGNV